VVALVSPEHANGIVWSESSVSTAEPDENDDDDRLFRFEVAKTKEEDENVTVRQGFEVLIYMHPGCIRHHAAFLDDFTPNFNEHHHFRHT